MHYANFWIIRHGYDGLAPGTGVYWSLAVEEHFYLLFPLLFLLLRRSFSVTSQRALVLALACGAILIWRLVLVYALGASPARTAMGSDTRFDSILFGCILAIYGNPVLDATKLSERMWKHVLFPLALAMLIVTFVIRDNGFRETIRYTMQGLCLVPVFVCALRYPTWIVMRPLNWRPIAHVGILSYSLYLMHQVVISAVGHRTGTSLSSSAFGLTALGISLAWASVVYQLVEKPLATVRKRFA
jgi:peptidoglycan/LPS O-acetylase OafA/YrhL